MAASELARAVALQQPQQGDGDAAEVIAALGGADQQDLTGWCGLCQAIGRLMATGLSLPRNERLDMRRVFDLLAFVETARMAGDDR
jgi:hypothetical protein